MFNQSSHRPVVRKGMFVLVVATLLSGLAPLASAGPCVVPNVGGTAALPPIGCEYIPPPGDQMHILPPAISAGNTIELDPILKDFFNEVEVPGGLLGGHIQTYEAVLEMNISGTGPDLGIFARFIQMQVTVETQSAPRTPGAPVQSFETQMMSIQGQVFGDPDFDSLSIVGGLNNGMPSPGHTILTRLGAPGSDFQVDSFFDILYEIDFEGADGSILGGMSGSTQGTIRLETGNPIPEPATLSLLAIGGMAFLRRRRTAVMNAE